MEFNKCKMESFCVIGKEGSTLDGVDFIKKLWQQANGAFGEVAQLATKDESGNLLGIWGLMSDFSRSFLPWQKNFSEGLYLAGIQCNNDAVAPSGWVKWQVPSFEYIYTENNCPAAFRQGIEYLKSKNLSLAGAVQEFSCPQTKKDYLFFPITKL